MTQCNLNAPLTLDKVDTILNRLLSDREHKPDLSEYYDNAINHYNQLRVALTPRG